MDCKHARLLLEFAHPRGKELEGGEAEALEGHLADCPECGALAHQERRLDDHLGRAVRAVPVPAGLRERLLNKLSVERDAWYRRLVLRTAGLVAAAAAVVLLVWGGLHTLRPEVDPVEVVDWHPRPGFTPEAVEQWFQDERNVHTAAPGRKYLNYQWLSYYDLVEFCGSGKRVPMLLFTYTGNDRAAQAQVFILTDHQFQGLKDLVDQKPQGSKGYEVKVLRNPDQPHFYYVVMYTEGAQSLFFVAGQPPAT
jgi:hypothetical protein